MSFYHPSMYDASRPVGSWWEDDAPLLPIGVDAGPAADASCDVAIIGGGYTGLSCALHLARDHKVDVRVLESGTLGWGASGRNGGFCTFPPSHTSFEGLIKNFGLEDARRFIDSQRDAVSLVRSLAESEGIDIQPQGDSTMIVAHAPNRWAGLQSEAKAMERLGIPHELHRAGAFAERFYDSAEQFGGLQVKVGFGLHPLRFARGLAAAAARHGAKLHAHSKVLGWTKQDGQHLLATSGGTIRAKRVVVATNGFLEDKLLPSLANQIMPVISNIIVTRPLTDSELRSQRWQTEIPCSNTRELLFYYRLLPDKRFLFGARGDTTGKPEDAAVMRAGMERRLGEVFPGWRDVETTHYWRGFVCMTRSSFPTIGQTEEDSTVWYGLGYHGNGVSAAPWTGQTLARLIAGAQTLASVPVQLTTRPAPIPFPQLKRWYLKLALAYYRFADL